MATAQSSRLMALIWLLLIFGSVLVIGLFAWSVITREPEPSTSTVETPDDGDPDTFTIDEQLDMLN